VQSGAFGQQQMIGQPMPSSVMYQQPQQVVTQGAVPNYEYVLQGGGVMAPAAGQDYQSASGSYYFQPNTPFVFYPADAPQAKAPAAGTRDVKVAKKKPKKKTCGCC